MKSSYSTDTQPIKFYFAMEQDDLITLGLLLRAHQYSCSCVSKLHCQTGYQQQNSSSAWLRGTSQDFPQTDCRSRDRTSCGLSQALCQFSVLIPFRGLLPYPQCHKYISMKHLQELLSNVLLEF